MLRIPCPYCGERDYTEFVYGGDASVPWPADPVARDASVELYRRANPAGDHTEYWQHALGCRQWLRVERDTVDHRVAKVGGRRPARPGDSPEGAA